MTAGDITGLLRAADGGDPGARAQLIERVYADLTRLAEKHFRGRFPAQRGDVTLEPAALVHESYLRLIEQRATIADREHFFALATRVMLRVLADYQRKRAAEKRGGDRRRVTVTLDGRAAVGGDPADRAESQVAIEALTRALEVLAEKDPRKAQVVQLKVFWARDVAQIAAILGVSRATVERDWAFAKAWLAREVARVEAAGLREEL